MSIRIEVIEPGEYELLVFRNHRSTFLTGTLAECLERARRDLEEESRQLAREQREERLPSGMRS